MQHSLRDVYLINILRRRRCMRVAICDDNQQDIERIRRYTLRMIDYAV